MPAGWAAENDCYGAGETFDADKWLSWLDRFRHAAANCLFAVAPDVLGDADATLERAQPYLPQIRGMGYRAAFVAQDGLEEPPWDEFDCLFIGGTTTYKLSEAAWAIGAEAKRRGKWWHVGRVNSFRRIRAAGAAGVDSVDGNCIAFAPDQSIGKVLRWLGETEEQPTLREAGDGQRYEYGQMPRL